MEWNEGEGARSPNAKPTSTGESYRTTTETRGDDGLRHNTLRAALLGIGAKNDCPDDVSKRVWRRQNDGLTILTTTIKVRANDDLSTHLWIMENPFTPHVSLNQSKLEEWRLEIQQMRSVNWPYLKISQWLLEKQGCHVHKDTIRKFCLVRKIKKGSSTQVHRKKTNAKAKSPPTPESGFFSYGEEESDRPIEIKRR